jgi:hypothetical protein
MQGRARHGRLKAQRTLLLVGAMCMASTEDPQKAATVAASLSKVALAVGPLLSCVLRMSVVQ